MHDPTKSPHHSPEDQEENRGISRRGFLKGAGLTAAGTALLDGVQAFSRETAAATNPGVTELGPGPVPVRLRINGKEHKPGDRAPYHVGRRIAYSSRNDWNQGRLRSGSLLGVHGLVRQDAGK